MTPLHLPDWVVYPGEDWVEITPREAGLDPVGLERVGWPGAFQPPAPSDPGVTVSRHRALLTS